MDLAPLCPGAAPSPLALLVEHVPATLVVFDREMRYLMVSRRFYREMGLPEQDLVGRCHYDVFPGLPPEWRAVHQRCLAGAVESRSEEPFPRADGTIDWVSWEIRPWHDREGAVGGIILFGEVVTARKQKEQQLSASTEALQRTEALLRAFSDALPDAMFAKDRASRWTFANPAALAIVGRPAVEVLGRSDAEIYADPAIGAALMETDRRIMDSGRPSVVEERVQTPAGYRVFLSTKVPYRDANGEVIGIFGAARDITEQRQLEAQLHQAQKLESVGRLAGGVAHDFNNLLTVILSCAELVRHDVARGAVPSAEDVELIRSAGERGRGLTRQLLAFARKEVVTPVALDVHEVVRGSEKMLRRILGEDVDVVVRGGEGLWSVLADPSQIEQVVLNLAVNARDAMPRGGCLVITTSNESAGPAGPEGPEAAGAAGAVGAAAGAPGDGRELATSTPRQRAGDWVRLRVTDTGVGMSAETKAHLFEPFFTTKEPGKGTGLGLATVYGIVRQSGGHILVESEEGRGTTFDLLLPRHRQPPQRDVPRPAAPAPGGHETVLLAEDDGHVRRLVLRVLRSAGYHVLEAASGDEALELAGREAGPIDMLVTDVVMPRVDGRALADGLRRLRPDLPVLYMSGYSLDILGQHGVLDPGIELLPKPFTTRQLLDRVRELLDRRRGAADPTPGGR